MLTAVSRTMAVAAWQLSIVAFLPGCAVVSVAATTVSVTASAVGLAADATVGTIRVVGKGVGMAADAMSGSTAPDTSGIQIRESIRPAP